MKKNENLMKRKIFFKGLALMLALLFIPFYFFGFVVLGTLNPSTPKFITNLFSGYDFVDRLFIASLISWTIAFAIMKFTFEFTDKEEADEKKKPGKNEAKRQSRRT